MKVGKALEAVDDLKVPYTSLHCSPQMETLSWAGKCTKLRYGRDTEGASLYLLTNLKWRTVSQFYEEALTLSMKNTRIKSSQVRPVAIFQPNPSNTSCSQWLKYFRSQSGPQASVLVIQPSSKAMGYPFRGVLMRSVHATIGFHAK